MFPSRGAVLKAFLDSFNVSREETNHIFASRPRRRRWQPVLACVLASWPVFWRSGWRSGVLAGVLLWRSGGWRSAWRSGVLAFSISGVLAFWLAFWRSGWRSGVLAFCSLAFWRSGVLLSGVLAFWRSGVLQRLAFCPEIGVLANLALFNASNNPPRGPPSKARIGYR